MPTGTDFLLARTTVCQSQVKNGKEVCLHRWFWELVSTCDLCTRQRAACAVFFLVQLCYEILCSNSRTSNRDSTNSNTRSESISWNNIAFVAEIESWLSQLVIRRCHSFFHVYTSTILDLGLGHEDQKIKVKKKQQPKTKKPQQQYAKYTFLVKLIYAHIQYRYL